jgi:TolB protein
LPALVSNGSARFVEWAAESNAQGTALTFESNDGGNREIFLWSQAGMSDLTKHPAPDWNPAWSPDGEWIAFESFRDGRRGVYRCSVSTGRVVAVDAGPRYDCWSPSWSPAGNQVAYVTTETGSPRLKVAPVRGKNKQMLSTGSVPAWAPAWAPDAVAGRPSRL